MISKWQDNVYVKIPITNTRGDSSLSLIKELSSEGVKLNVTAMLTLDQVREAVMRKLEALRPAEVAKPSTGPKNNVVACRLDDRALASLDALVEVRDALGAKAVVLMDSGIRRGADVIKALALGANAVLLGRPYVYGLTVAGQAGVERVMRNLTAEIDLTLALTGGRDVKALDRSWITLRP